MPAHERPEAQAVGISAARSPTADDPSLGDDLGRLCEAVAESDGSGGVTLDQCSIALQSAELAMDSGGYSRSGAALAKAFPVLLEKENSRIAEQLASLLLLLACQDLPARLAESRLPEPVAGALSLQRSRIIHEFRVGDADYVYGVRNDNFLKDLAMMCLRLLPCGAELVERSQALPRSLLYRGGLKQGARFLRLVMRVGGLGPFYQLHMDRRQLNEFNPRGWERTYLRIGALLRRNPEIRGVFGTAWFYDPTVSQISPHLAYLRTQRESNGAINLRYGPSSSARSGALATSFTRRSLYDAGRYQPCSYYLVWPRESLLVWCSRQERRLHLEAGLL